MIGTKEAVGRVALLVICVCGVAGAKTPDAEGARGSGQPAQAGSKPGDGNAMVTEHARAALARITEAQQALANDSTDKAKGALLEADKLLRPMYTGARGETALKQLGETQQKLERGGAAGGIDFAPLLTAVRELEVYVDPAAMANVKQAESEAKAGKSGAAQRSLRLARDVIAADVALLPVEDAFARVRAAQAELQAGNKDVARRLIDGIPVLMTELQLAAPLAPVRVQLLGAAQAVQGGNLEQAKHLINDAARGLQTLEENSQGWTAEQIRPLRERARELQRQLQNGRSPDAAAFRQLASSTRQLGSTTDGTGGSQALSGSTTRIKGEGRGSAPSDKKP